MDRKTLEQNYQASLKSNPSASLEENYRNRSGMNSLVSSVKTAVQYDPNQQSAPSTQPTQAAPAGASSSAKAQTQPVARKQSEIMQDEVDALKKQRDDAAIKAGAYMRAGNMQQQAKEAIAEANRLTIELENKNAQQKTQKNIEATEDYDPSKNHFKAGDMAVAAVQGLFQDARQSISAASAYLAGASNASARLKAAEAKRLIDSGMNGTEAFEKVGLTSEQDVPTVDYETQAELRHKKNIESTGPVESGLLQLGYSGIQMLGTKAMDAVFPGLGLPVLAMSVAGNKYKTATEKYGKSSAGFVLGLASGLTSYYVEQLGGAFGDSRIAKLVDGKIKAANPYILALAKSPPGKAIADALSESAEEGIEDVVNWAIEKTITGESDEMDNIVYDMLAGALLGGVFGGANAAARNIAYNRIGKTLNSSPEAIAQQIQSGLEKGEGTEPYIYATEMQNDPSNYMAGRLFEANKTFDANEGLSKISTDITRVSLKEMSAMLSDANTTVKAAQKLGVEPASESVITAITEKQKAAATEAAKLRVEDAFVQTVDSPANVAEQSFNNAVAGSAANQTIAYQIYKDPAARASFSRLTGLKFTGDQSVDVAAIQVTTRKVAEQSAGKTAISSGEMAARKQAAADAAAAQYDADLAAQAQQMQEESNARWLSLQQNTITDIDGKRHLKEITNTDVRGNTEISYKKAEITKPKKKAVDAVNNAAKYLGKTIVWYEGALQVNGQYRLANGFRAPDGTIYVNINSKNPLMVTFGHEMFHDLVSSGKYGSMIDTLVQSPEYAATIKVELDHTEELYKANGIDLSADEAAEEVAADICGTILNSKSMLEYIGARNAEAATGIKGFLNRILNKLKGKPSAQEAYDLLSESQRALIDGMEGRAETGVNTLHLVDNITKKAVSSIRPQTLGSFEPITASSEGSNSFSADRVPQSDTAVNNYSMQNSAEDALLDSSKVKIVGNGDVDIALPEGYEDIGIAVTGEGSAAPNRYSLMSFRESELGTDKVKYATRLAKATGVSVQLATDWINSVYSVAAIIGDDKARLDYEANRNNTSLKPNSEYDFSLDFSTLCAKRLLFSGTMDAIQSALPNTPLTSEDFVHLREIMKDSGYEVACGICYVESTRREFSTISEGFVEQYRKAQAEGTNIKKVNASGQTKDLTTSKGIENSDPNRFVYPEKGFTPTLADLVTAEGIDRLQAEHPEVYKAFNAYMNARGQQKPKMIETRTDYRGEILNMTKGQVSRRNSHGGLRIQSFSDFEVPHLIDMMQAVYDMSTMGLKGQAYTKVPSFARAMGQTGIKINLSLIAKGEGVDANGNLIFDDIEGMPASEAFAIRNDPRFSDNVGTILVGKNTKHIVAAMADPQIDFIIPFHKSSWSVSLYKALGLEGYEDYTDYQNEKKPGDRIENYDPSEYWDFSKTGDENAQAYLEKCREDGRTPKFSEVMYNGKSLTEYPGYWKLLIDFKMYNNDGAGAEQVPVRPVFDDEFNAELLADYNGGHRKLPVAQDIVDRFVSEKKSGQLSLMDTLPQEKYFADLEQSKEEAELTRVEKEISDEETARINETAAELSAEGAEASEFVKAVDTVADLKKQLSDLRKQTQKEAKQNAKWYEAEAKLIAEIAAAKGKEKAAQQKIAYEDKLSALAETYKNQKLKERIRRANSADRKKLYSLLKRANSLAKKSSPENKNALLEMIGDVDLFGIGMLETGYETKDGKVVRGRTDLSELKEVYNSYKETNPDFLGDLGLEKKLDRLDKRQIADMTPYEVRDLIEAATALVHKVQSENKLINDTKRRSTFKIAQDVISELENVKGRKDSKVDPVKNLYGFESLRPKTAFLKMAGGKEGAWTSMYDILNKGQLDMLTFQQKVAALFDPFSNKHYKEMQKWSGEKAEWMKVSSQNGEVEITPAMAISLYLHSLNDQNMRHIDTGIKIPNKNLYKQGKTSNAYDRGRRVRFTKSDINAIYEQFTPAMKGYASLVHDFFNGIAKEEINKTSVALDGYEKALVENYFPIKTDANFTVKDIDALVRDITIEGWKNLEERTNAKNPSILEDVDTVVNRHINSTAKYVGLAIPVRNFNAVYNGMSVRYATSVKEQLRKKWEDQGSKYVEKLLINLQAGNNNSQDPVSRGLRTVRGLSAQAVLSANLPVSMKQVASLPTAASNLGFGSVLHGLKKVDEDLINKYTPLLWYRSLGNIDTAYSEATKAKGGLNKLPKRARQIIGLTWIQSFDRWAVKRIWAASEYWVEQNRPSLEKGTDSFYREVAKVFNDAVEETQPNYTTMQRPQLLRSDSELVKSLTMYQTQRMQNYNIIYERAIVLRNAKEELKANATPQNKAKAKKAGRAMARSIVSLVGAGLMIGAIDTAAYGLLKRRDEELEDEDGNITAASVAKYVGKKTADSLIGNILFCSELENLLLAAMRKEKWYEVDVAGVEQLNDVLTGIVNWQNAFNDYTGKVVDNLAEGKPLGESLRSVYNGTMWAKTVKLAKSLSTVFGVPAYNIATLLGNGMAYVSPEFAGWWDNRNTDTEKAWEVRKAANISWKQYYEYADSVAKQKSLRGGDTTTIKDKAIAIAAQDWAPQQKEAAWESVRGNSKKSLDAQLVTYSARGDNTSLSQEELYTYLKGSTISDKQAIWAELFPDAKLTYAEYAKKHG